MEVANFEEIISNLDKKIFRITNSNQLRTVIKDPNFAEYLLYKYASGEFNILQQLYDRFLQPRSPDVSPSKSNDKDKYVSIPRSKPKPKTSTTTTTTTTTTSKPDEDLVLNRRRLISRPTRDLSKMKRRVVSSSSSSSSSEEELPRPIRVVGRKLTDSSSEELPSPRLRKISYATIPRERQVYGYREVLGNIFIYHYGKDDETDVDNYIIVGEDAKKLDALLRDVGAEIAKTPVNGVLTSAYFISKETLEQLQKSVFENVPVINKYDDTEKKLFVFNYDRKYYGIVGNPVDNMDDLFETIGAEKVEDLIYRHLPTTGWLIRKDTKGIKDILDQLSQNTQNFEKRSRWNLLSIR